MNIKLRKGIRNLIIGKNHYIESQGEFRQVMLSGQFAMVGMIVLLVNCSFEEMISLSLLVYGFSFAALGFSVYLHRQARHITANYLMLATANFTTYVFASSESIRTGSFAFFTVIAVGAFAVFDYTKKTQAVLCAILTLVCFYMAYFVDFSILPWREYSTDAAMNIALINFGTALAVSVMIVYLLISINHYSSQQLAQNNRLLVKTNSELDRFVYSTSHDLRAPLLSVMGLINISENVEDPAVLKRYMGMMKDRMLSLDKFIKDITDYSRNNRKEIGRERFNLKDLAVEVWDELKYSPEASLIEFDVKISDQTEVQSDKSRLKIILGNLISNAIRYHDRRKPNPFIRLHYIQKDQGFHLRVEDNGQGIAPEYHHKIFDMFYRANESSSGSGLGLYIVKETLERLSGDILLESKPGAGSAFTLLLPN